MADRLRILALVAAAFVAPLALADDAAKPAEPPAKSPAAKSADGTGAAKAGDAEKDAPKSAGKKGAGADAKKPPVAAAAPRAAAPRSLDEALRRLARRRVTIEFDAMAMDDVVAFIGRIAELNTMVAPEYQAKAAGALPTVTLKLTDVSLRQFAEMVAKLTGSKMVLRDGVLQFTTPEDARGRPVLHVFALSDLTFRIRNFPGPDIQLHTGDVRYVQEEESEQESAFDDPQAIVDMLKKFTGEGTWDDEDVSISADERKLVVKQYPEVLKEIARFLAVMRAAK